VAVTARREPGPPERFAFNPPSPAVSAAQALPGTKGGSVPESAGPVPPPAPSRRSFGSPFRRKATAAAEPRDWAFTWTLVFTALLFLRPQDYFEPLGALHLAELSALFALVSLVMGRLARRETITRVTPEFVGVLALGAVMLLTAPFSIWFGGAVGVFQELYLKVILIYLLAINVLNSPKRLERLTWILVLSLGYLAMRAVADYARGLNVTTNGTRVMGAYGSAMQNPNDLALHMVVFLPLAALFAMRTGTILTRLTGAACAISMMGAIVASGSRSGFLGFAAMMVVFGAFAARKRPGFVAAAVLVMLCSLPVLPDSYYRRIASITDDSKDDVQSAPARRRLMAESYDAFLQNPLTGVGAGQFKDWNPRGREEAWHEAHNVWLQVAAELGIFGIVAFQFLMFRSFHSVFQTRRLLGRYPDTPDAEFLDMHSIAVAASLTGFFVCAFFSSVAYYWTFYYLLVLASAPRDILRDRAAVLAEATRGRPAGAMAVSGAARRRAAPATAPAFARSAIPVPAPKVRA
jgi:probable O-glycosylation ligase (exosortase A-associated)